LVPNLARPGEFSIGTKWLEALKQIAPRVSQVALIYNPETAPYAELFQRPVEAAAPAFAVMPMTVAARSAPELERAVDAFARTPNGGLLVLPDVTNLIHRDQIIALAARHRLPAVYPYRYYAASGGLLSYGSEQADVFRRAASYVDHILKGTSPGELPVQASIKYELVINLKTAKALDLEVPPMLIARADDRAEVTSLAARYRLPAVTLPRKSGLRRTSLTSTPVPQPSARMLCVAARSMVSRYSWSIRMYLTLPRRASSRVAIVSIDFASSSCVRPYTSSNGMVPSLDRSLRHIRGNNVTRARHQSQGYQDAQRVSGREASSLIHGR
jgi:ABC transporter substrate binding protein